MSQAISTNQAEIEEQLPRDPERYRFTLHAMQRFKDNERLVNGSTIRAAIKEGEISEGERPGTSDFTIEFGALHFTLVVNNTPDSGGIREIVTLFPNRR